MPQHELRPSNKEINHVLKEVQNSNERVLEEFFLKYPNLHWTHLYYEKTGDTVLHCAARQNLVHTIDFLLLNFNPKSVDCKNKDDKTALHEAAQFSKYEACEKLLRHGANVNALKRADWTPLMLVCAKTHGEMSLKTVKVLLENGAIMNCKNKDGWTALHLISRDGDARILQALLERDLEVNSKTKNGRTALHIAALHGNKEIVDILLNLGLYADERDSCGNTPLHEAALGNSIEVCGIFIKHGGNICGRNDRGYGLLHLAASEGHLKVIDFVLNDLKWDINETTADGFTALHCATRNGRTEAYNYLIKKGGDLRIKDKCGRDPVSYLK